MNLEARICLIVFLCVPREVNDLNAYYLKPNSLSLTFHLHKLGTGRSLHSLANILSIIQHNN